MCAGQEMVTIPGRMYVVGSRRWGSGSVLHRAGRIWNGNTEKRARVDVRLRDLLPAVLGDRCRHPANGRGRGPRLRALTGFRTASEQTTRMEVDHDGFSKSCPPYRSPRRAPTLTTKLRTRIGVRTNRVM